MSNCPICKATKWEYMDDLRDADYWRAADYIGAEDKLGWKWCKACGFVTYDYVSDEELDRRYSMIRPSINVGNLVTQNRKLKYHGRMVGGMRDDEKLLRVLDYGASIGTYLSWWWAADNEVEGVELSDISRQAAKALYNLDLKKTLDEVDGSFDIITLYHVLEHLQHPDKILAELVGRLNDGGIVYIAIPEYWGDELHADSGESLRDVEHYWHLNHVNMFSRQDLANLLAVCGLEIYKFNDEMYGYTVLARKTDKPAAIVPDKRDKRKMATSIRDAIKAHAAGDNAAALKAWPYYPEAIISTALNPQTMADSAHVIGTLRDGMKRFPQSRLLAMQLAQSLLQWDENKKGPKTMTPAVREARDIIAKHVEESPGNDNAWFLLGLIAIKYERDIAKALRMFDECNAINPMRWKECYGVALAGLTYGA